MNLEDGEEGWGEGGWGEEGRWGGGIGRGREGGRGLKY